MSLLFGIFVALSQLSLLGSAAVVFTWLYLSPLSLLSLAVVAVAALAYTRPRAALGAALIAIPFGGNRPGTTQAEVALVVASSLLIGLWARRFHVERVSQRQLWQQIAATPLLLTAFLYLLFSCGSLVSIPLPELIDELRNITDRSSLYQLAFSVRWAIMANEHTLLYSVVSVYMTTLCFFLAVSVWQICLTDRGRNGKLFFGCILIGLVATFLLGVLDYYALISLTSFRELDPIVNQNNRQFRLQSVFAHSGWYAEYVTLTIPTCLMILALRAPFWLRTTIVLTVLALGEFVLILTYQRGGWLSYPLTLIAVWAAIYVVRRLEQGSSEILAALKRSSVKVLVSLPITVAISLLLVLALQRGSSSDAALSPYVSRFKEIQRTGDRTDFLFAGLLLGIKHPIMGGASDSFAWQFEREFEADSGSYFGLYTLPLHGSAHNVYAQTFSGKGLCGLIALIALPILIIRGAYQSVISRATSLHSNLLVLTGACFASAFLIYGNVQEVFYIQVLQFLFFAVIGIIAAELPQRAKEPRFVGASPAALFAILLATHVLWEFGWPGQARANLRTPHPFGCFPLEKLPSGGSYRWCSERAVVTVSTPALGTPAVLTLEAGPIGQTITVVTNHATGSTSVIELAPGERKQVAVALNPSGSTLARLTATGSFVPANRWPDSNDRRRLAFKVVSNGS
jgi:O-antigen ligase